MIQIIDNTYYLNTKNTTYIMRASEGGILTHIYYGRRIKNEQMGYFNILKPFDCSAPITCGELTSTLDAIPQEIGGYNRGDYRISTAIIADSEGHISNDFRFVQHEIISGIIRPSIMPCLDNNTDNVGTLVITLEDIVSKVNVKLFYSVFEESNVIARHLEIVNNTDKTVTVKKALSASLDIERNDFDTVSLYGRWANERNVEILPLKHGINEIFSNRGATGHHANPFFALAEKKTTETTGDVFGVSLVYSGNFKMGAELSQFETTRLYAGINNESFSWELKAEESFATPQALLTFSDEGFGGMSRNFHTACRNHLGKCSENIKRPIVLNLWEAFYFDIEQSKVLNSLDGAKELGIDTVVIDDGWFGKRIDPTSSLGDWDINKDRFPQGFDIIVSECDKRGLKLGLWFEPEMISKDSNLFRKHPDWCIHIDSVEAVQSRNQFVLDYSREDVIDYVFESIASIIRKYKISYIKWDMNRNITDIGSSKLDSNQLSGYSHRYILGLYSLLNKVNNEFSDLFIEGSAGGGGRFDFGILYYMPLVWASDNSDGIERLGIQYGTSFVFPPETISCHVSVCPNHQTGRTIPLKTRGNVATMFNLGYELDISKLDKNSKDEIKNQVSVHCKLSDWLQKGDFYRLISPNENDVCAWQSVSKDKNNSVCVYVSKQIKANSIGKYLRLTGLDENKNYYVSGYDITLSGSTLMYAGLPIMNHNHDYDSTIIFLAAK